MQESSRFKKWQWIEASVIKADNDSRPESFKVDASSITVQEDMPAGSGWKKRWAQVESLVLPSLEAVKATNASLGLIKPKKFEMTFEDENEPNWTPEQRAKLESAPGASDLFGNSSTPLKLLEKMPVKIRYRYECDDSSCNGHEQLFEDWEVCEAWRSWAPKYRDRAELEAKLRQRFVDIPTRKDNLFLFVGTMAKYPDTWLVIGHTQPAHLAAT